MSEGRSGLPSHGRIACSWCFGSSTVWNVSSRTTEDGWHIVNNPMSWGSATPRVLLLGVSKGTTQCRALDTKPHDLVPFDGFRPKLTDALRLLGLLGSEEAIDGKIRIAEQDWAFGSMVRCALGLVDRRDGRISRSGTVVQRLAGMPETASWLVNCTSEFLSHLPDTLRVCSAIERQNVYRCLPQCRQATTC